MKLLGACAAAFSLVSLAVSASVDCITSELKEVVKTTEILTCAVNDFQHCRGNPLHGLAHDIRPLTHIYKLGISLDDQLDNLIDDIQCSCDFSKADSEKLLYVLASASGPIEANLDAFAKKHCQIEQALGPALTHRVVGGTLKRTRCLTMDMLRSIECKIDDMYKEVVSAAQSEIDHSFQKVLRIY